MRTGRSSFNFGILLALLLPGAAAHAATFATVREQDSSSDPGTRFSTEQGGSVQLRLDQPGNRLVATVSVNNTQHEFQFVGPDGAVLTPGRYDNTSPTGFPVAGYARLEHVAGNTACSLGPPGYFIVREFQYPTGTDGLPHVAIDYFHRCGRFVDVRRPMNTFGSIRINSDIAAMDFPPFADANSDIVLDEGEIIGLNAERSYPGDAPITSTSYRQLSGPTASPVPSGGGFTAPPVPIGGAQLSFELTVTNALGLTSTDVIDVKVNSLQGRRTFIALDGEPGHAIYPTTGVLKPYQNGGYAELTATGSDVTGRASIWYLPIGPGANPFTFSFKVPDGLPFAPGNYEGAVRIGSPSQPEISVGANGRGCSVENGRFVVLESDFDPDTSVARSLAIDFEQYCEDRPDKLLGYIRINSAVPVHRDAPDAAAGNDQNSEIGARVDLDGSNTIPGNGTVSTWRWRQVSGTAVTLTGANTANASFTAPNVGASSETLVFELSVTNTGGFTDTDDVNVFVRGSGGLRNYARITGDVNEPITGGGTFEYTIAQDITVPDGLYDRSYTRVRIPSVENWDINFRAPTGQELKVGRYDNVGDWTGVTPTRAGVGMTGRGVGCTTADGSLRIYEISFDPQTNAVTRLAADFDARCQSSSTFAHGSVRYRSALASPFDGVLAAAGADQQVDERSKVTLDAAQSVSAGGTRTYRWTQTSGTAVTLANSTTAAATFDAPAVSGASISLEFEVQVSDGAGHSSTDRVRVNIVDRSRRQTLVMLSSDPADSIGRGDNITLRPEDWNFTDEPAADGHYLGLHFAAVDRWDLWFATDGNNPFQVGTYNNARHTTTGTAPTINITGRAQGCQSLGNFNVRRVALTNTGALDGLVLDFARRCDGSTAELRGTVVYRAVMPDANAGADVVANEGTTVTLNGSQSTVEGGSPQYRWTQSSGPTASLTGATSASATFTAPDVAVDTVLAFQLEVTDSALLKTTDSVQVTVHAVVPSGAGGGSSSSGGGGGALTPMWLALLSVILFWRRALASAPSGDEPREKPAIGCNP